jgi:nucleoside-diphosphate-sugar epimerase
VYDFCTAITALIETQKSGVFNICSGNEYQLIDIIELIRKEIGLGEIFYDKSLYRSYSSKYICGSNHKLKHETGWNPVIDLQQGIINTINSTNHLNK